MPKVFIFNMVLIEVKLEHFSLSFQLSFFESLPHFLSKSIAYFSLVILYVGGHLSLSPSSFSLCVFTCVPHACTHTNIYKHNLLSPFFLFVYMLFQSTPQCTLDNQ